MTEGKKTHQLTEWFRLITCLLICPTLNKNHAMKSKPVEVGINLAPK